MTYHVDRDGKALCGAKLAKGDQFVDRPVRATCRKCRGASDLEPLAEVKVAVREPPSRDEVLARLIEVLCDSSPAARRGLCEEALYNLGERKL